jgi:hypothetical protein
MVKGMCFATVINTQVEKPCIFPFTVDGITYSQCIPMTSNQNEYWCYTIGNTEQGICPWVAACGLA